MRLPGPTSQNVFDFGTPYTRIKEVVKGTDFEWYNERGLVSMLERNVRLKLAPERWQDIETSEPPSPPVGSPQPHADLPSADRFTLSRDERAPRRLTNRARGSIAELARGGKLRKADTSPCCCR